MFQLRCVINARNSSWQLSQIFPTFSSAKRAAPANSAFAKIKARRAALKRAGARPPLQIPDGGLANG